MSGLSLAVAPRSAEPSTPVKNQSIMGGLMGSLRVIELQLVAFIMVFSASGLVPLFDLIFPAFATFYALLLSKFAFPSPKGASAHRQTFHGSRLFQAYVVVGTTIGLFLPLAYVLGGFARGDDGAVRSATPHLFLLSCQILTENVVGGLSLFSPPVRAVVSILYTARRIAVIVDWNGDVWVGKDVPGEAGLRELVWLWFGRGLAAANLGYFAANLLLFLIPRFLPRAFLRYFKERGEVEERKEGGGMAAEENVEKMKKDE